MLPEEVHGLSECHHLPQDHSLLTDTLQKKPTAGSGDKHGDSVVQQAGGLWQATPGTGESEQRWDRPGTTQGQASGEALSPPVLMVGALQPGRVGSWSS